MGLRVLIASLVTVLVAAAMPTAAIAQVPEGPNPEACMFNAPDGASGYGHVGWAVNNGGDGWVGGATEIKDNENKDQASWVNRQPSSSGAMWDMFRTRPERRNTPYTRFRCKEVDWGHSNRAVLAFEKAVQRDYHGINDNCLTRSIEAYNEFHHHIAGSAVGQGTRPNDYFENYLGAQGWGPIRSM